MSLTSLVLLLGLAASVVGAQNDDSLAYTGFILDTPMPTARSDMTATKLVRAGFSAQLKSGLQFEFCACQTSCSNLLLSAAAHHLLVHSALLSILLNLLDHLLILLHLLPYSLQ
jgi:hypothetical protein